MSSGIGTTQTNETIEAVIAQLWVIFGMAATMEIHTDAAIWVRQRLLSTIASNYESFPNDGATQCIQKAAQVASGLAAQRNSRRIRSDDIQKAFEIVAAQQQEIRSRPGAAPEGLEGQMC